MGRSQAPSKLVRRLLRLRGRVVKAFRQLSRWLTSRFLRQPRTPGEAAFEEYLRENGIAFAYEVQEQGKNRRPDYTITFDGQLVKVDVKDVEDDAYEGSVVDEEMLEAVALGEAPDEGVIREQLPVGGAYDPHGRLRAKVNTARAQFKEYKGTACAVAFFCDGLSDADLRSPEIMLGVMYGNFGISIPFNAERGDFVGTKAQARFLSGGSVVHRREPQGDARIQNTTFSALITIRQVKIGCARLAEYYDQHPDPNAVYTYDPVVHGRLKADEVHYGLIVWDNAFAATPLPDGLFCGPYDERWTRSESGTGNVRTHQGEKLQWTLERYPDGVSPLGLS